MFVKSVARGRRASQDDVRAGFGQGRMVMAAQALKEGMVDRVATMDEVLSRLGASDANPPKMAAELPSRPKADEHDDPLDEQDCICGCDACRADDHMNCSNPECADPNCGHEPRAKAAAQLSPLAAIKKRRRDLDLRG
jgi:ClpP class serine protease